MSDKQTPRLLPFVALDRDSLNRELDLEILDRERERQLTEMAEAELRDLDFDRFLDGLID